MCLQKPSYSGPNLDENFPPNQATVLLPSVASSLKGEFKKLSLVIKLADLTLGLSWETFEGDKFLEGENKMILLRNVIQKIIPFPDTLKEQQEN